MARPTDNPHSKQGHARPKIIAQVNKEKESLSHESGGNSIRKWREEVIDAAEPQQPHGFEVE